MTLNGNRQIVSHNRNGFERRPMVSNTVTLSLASISVSVLQQQKLIKEHAVDSLIKQMLIHQSQYEL